MAAGSRSSIPQRGLEELQHPRRDGRRLRLRCPDHGERRCLDRHLVGRQPHPRRRARRFRELGSLHRRIPAAACPTTGSTVSPGRDGESSGWRPRAGSHACRWRSGRTGPMPRGSAPRWRRSRPISPSAAIRARHRAIMPGRNRAGPGRRDGRLQPQLHRRARCRPRRGGLGGHLGGGAQPVRRRGLDDMDGQDGLPGNHVFSIHVDARGRIWIGTNAGSPASSTGGSRPSACMTGSSCRASSPSTRRARPPGSAAMAG